MFLDALGVINKVENLSVSRLNKADSVNHRKRKKREIDIPVLSHLCR